MKYTKPALSFDDQLDQLARRGMTIPNRAKAQQHLEHISYYRLSGYWLPFEATAPTAAGRCHTFSSGITFDMVVDLYVFDRKLRLMVMEAIERIEVSLRTRWSHELATTYDPHAFLNSSRFKDPIRHAEDLVKLNRDIRGSKEVFIESYRKKYKEPELPPSWMACEVMTMGALSRWYQNLMDGSLKKRVAQGLGIKTVDVFESILHHLTVVRNICAHHGRLWNRRLVVIFEQPHSLNARMVPHPTSPQDPSVEHRYLFNTLVLLDGLMMHITTGSSWTRRLTELLTQSPTVDPKSMGFPSTWKTREPWKAYIQ